MIKKQIQVIRQRLDLIQSRSIIRCQLNFGDRFVDQIDIKLNAQTPVSSTLLKQALLKNWVNVVHFQSLQYPIDLSSAENELVNMQDVQITAGSLVYDNDSQCIKIAREELTDHGIKQGALIGQLLNPISIDQQQTELTMYSEELNDTYSRRLLHSIILMLSTTLLHVITLKPENCIQEFADSREKYELLMNYE